MSAGPAAGATPAQVDAAIAKGVTYLQSVEKDGNWEAAPAPAGAMLDPNGGQWGGTTAIATYALLCAGERESGASVSAAVRFLKAHKAQGVYASASRCLVWSRIEMKPDVRVAGNQDVAFLLSAVKSQGAGRGLLFYIPATSPTDAQYDHSASQFAVLGLNSLIPMGFEIPGAFWNLTDEAWRNHQNTDGSWSYIKDGGPDWGTPTDSMTLAAIATLAITRAHVHEGGACHGNEVDTNADKAMAWVAKQGPGALVAPQRTYPDQNYTQFTASRVGLATGCKYFGDIDWYQRGSDYLISAQRPDGSWAGYGPVPAETALAILALTYGSAPVIINKLEYSVAAERGKAETAHWNQRPQDIPNFTDWMGRGLEQRLSWQTVSLGSATLDDLHEAPVLYISGDQAIDFSPADCDKLRLFVEQGGLILGNADCDSANFTKSFLKLGQTLFPRYEFRQLPGTHPIFSEQFRANKWKTRPTVAGLSNGVRELMLLPKADLSRAFQAQNSQIRPELFQLADNIVLYCTEGAHLRRKGETYIVKADPSIATNGSVKIARLDDTGNWDPEPAGWAQLTAVMRNTCKTDLIVQTARLGEPIPTDCRLAHLTGTEPIKFSDKQRASIVDYVQAGGTLVIDAAGGSADFARGAENELRTMFGADATAGLSSPLPLASPVYQLGSMKIDSVAYRRFARDQYVGSLNEPRIFGISHGGRIIVYYSREDLSNALVGVSVDGVTGYEPQSATALMRNIILAAAGHH
jgi:hypothetical protein